MISMELDQKEMQQLRANLEAMKDSVARKLSAEAVEIAAAPILADATQRAPSRTGVLKRSMGMKLTKRRGFASAIIGPRSRYYEDVTFHHRDGSSVTRKVKPSKYAHLVELGSKSHKIPAPKHGLLKVFGVTIAGGVDHPGTQAQPFLRPAFDANVQRFFKVYGRELYTRLEAVMKKGGK
jgi:HK97 gp10 family phage protein